MKKNKDGSLDVGYFCDMEIRFEFEEVQQLKDIYDCDDVDAAGLLFKEDLNILIKELWDKKVKELEGESNGN